MGKGIEKSAEGPIFDDVGRIKYDPGTRDYFVYGNESQIEEQFKVKSFEEAYNLFQSERQALGKNVVRDIFDESLPEFKMRIEVDGIEFVSNTLDEKTFLEAYNLAKHKVGGPYVKPYRPCQVEIIPPESPLSVTDVKGGRIFTIKAALAHELIHYILGVDIFSGKWPRILGEFFAHSASPRDGMNRYDFADLSGDFISMTSDELATTPFHNFFYDARKETFVKLNDKIGDAKRKRIVKAALKKDKIAFEEVAKFLGKFGVNHPILREGKIGIQKVLLYGRSEDGREFLLPVIYDRQKDSESPVNGNLTLEFRGVDGKKLGEVSLSVGTDVQNTGLIFLSDFFDFLDQASGIKRKMVSSIYVKETNQTIALK